MTFTPLKPLRPPEQDGEIWQPRWDCFCCHDTGIILRKEWVLESPQNYALACNRPSCSSGAMLRATGGLDTRVPPAICEQIHELERESWRQTTKEKVERIRALANQQIESFTESF